jgi:hypothetical protein
MFYQKKKFYNTMNHFKILKKWTNEPIFRYLKTKYITGYKIDHIAYRSFNNKQVISYLTEDNYQVQIDKYNFKNHNASAIWLKNTKNIIPRVFLSEYNGIYTDQKLMNSGIDVDKINYHINNENEKISYELYLSIYNINQYLAWTIIFRHNIINHIAIHTEEIELLFKFLQKDEIVGLSSNLQISEDHKLLQFSTKPINTVVQFSDGEFYIPTYFFEFIKRIDKREGFSEKNADIIFNSTRK